MAHSGHARNSPSLAMVKFGVGALRKVARSHYSVFLVVGKVSDSLENKMALHDAILFLHIFDSFTVN